MRTGCSAGLDAAVDTGSKKGFERLAVRGG